EPRRRARPARGAARQGRRTATQAAQEDQAHQGLGRTPAEGEGGSRQREAASRQGYRRLIWRFPIAPTDATKALEAFEALTRGEVQLVFSVLQSRSARNLASVAMTTSRRPRTCRRSSNPTISAPRR